MAGIKYIPHDKINMEKWDSMVNSSTHPLIYAQSWYLDTITENSWDALVLGDYEAGMPLPVKRKMGISIIYQPFFCQQLGIFQSQNIVTGYDAFLKSIPKHFASVYLQLHGGLDAEIYMKPRTNYVVYLNKSLHEIVNNYHPDVHKNLRKANRINAIITANTTIDEVIDTYKKAWGNSNKEIKEEHYLRFKTLFEMADKKGQAELYAAKSGDVLLGTAAVFLSEKMVHYVLAAPTNEGKKYGIMHSIIAAIAEKHCQTGRNLDLEGSEIPSVKNFYKKFDPLNEPYFVYQKEKWWFSVIKALKKTFTQS